MCIIFNYYKKLFAVTRVILVPIRILSQKKVAFKNNHLETVNEIAPASLTVRSRLLEGAALFHYKFVACRIESGQVGVGGRAGMRTPIYREFCKTFKNFLSLRANTCDLF